MTMTPRDLLDFADELSGDDREAAWRLSAHAAYYAAFHQARAVLTAMGFAVPDSDRAYLWLRLQNCGHPEVIEAGNDFGRARSLRNRADYTLGTPFANHQAAEQVARADGIVETLEQLAELPEASARVAQAVRDYERDVLKEVTWRG